MVNCYSGFFGVSEDDEKVKAKALKYLNRLPDLVVQASNMGIKQFEYADQNTNQQRNKLRLDDDAIVPIDKITGIEHKKTRGHLSKKQMALINGFVIILKELLMSSDYDLNGIDILSITRLIVTEETHSKAILEHFLSRLDNPD